MSKVTLFFLRVVEVKSLFTHLKLMAQNLNLKSKMTKRFMTPVLFGLILYFYVVQPDVERLPGS